MDIIYAERAKTTTLGIGVLRPIYKNEIPLRMAPRNMEEL